jgi:hypothetical protein
MPADNGRVGWPGAPRAENNVETGLPHAPAGCGYSVGLSAAEEDSIFEAPITRAWFVWKGS